MVYAFSGAAILAVTIYVIKKTGFFNEFGERGPSTKILSVCISVFGLCAMGWAVWEGLLKHVPFIIVCIVLGALGISLCIFGVRGLIEGLHEEYMTPREKLARDIADAIREKQDED
jgi:hypothetical protein